MEADDIFTDQMKICRPVFLEQFTVIAIAVVAKAGDIVGQCIQPYIGNMLRIKGNRNAPGEGGSGYAQILQTRQKEIVHHLILSGYRLDELRMLVDVRDQAVCVFAHFEEVSFLFGRLYLAAAVWALAVYQLRLGKEGLTRCAVKALIIAFVNITLIVQFFEDFLYLSLMIGISGTDEFVVGSVHQIPDCLDLTCHIVYKLLRSYTCSLSL